MSVADRLASLTPEQRALFEALRQKQRQTAAAAAPAAPSPIERVSGPRGVGDWPLTFDQERYDQQAGHHWRPTQHSWA